MRALWPVLGALVILGIIFVGLAENEPETITSSTEPTETVIIPKTFQAESQEISIKPKSFQSSPEINQLEIPNQNPTIIQTADGITTDENSLIVKRYVFVGNPDRGQAFDDLGNIFAGGSNKVGRIDVVANTQITWTLPNDQIYSGQGGDTDSSGFYYFGMSDFFSGDFDISFLAKLDHNTNIFTQWQIDTQIRDIAIDSSDSVYFTENSSPSFLQKLDTDSNTITEFFFPSELSSLGTGINKIVFDSSEKIYFFSHSGDWNLVKFDPSTNALTVWSLPNDIGQSSIGVGPSGKIVFGESVIFRNKLAQLDPSTNILKEWTIPFASFPQRTVVDNEIILFGGTFSRFVPSTNTFTEWTDVETNSFLEIAPDGKIRWADGRLVGTISSPPPPPPPVDTTEVSVPPGSSTPGCEETNECYIPFSASIDVGAQVTWTNEDTAAHTVTSGTPSDGPDGTFDSSLIMAGTTFSHTFNDAGTFDYFCMVHPWQRGQVIVS